MCLRYKQQEYDGSINSVASNIYGSVLHRRS